nr:MAG TPA: hypothetical protein [Caudoviricetes sp.]
MHTKLRRVSSPLTTALLKTLIWGFERIIY